MLCVRNLKDFPQDCWHSELFETHELDQGISCSDVGQRLQYLLGFDQCLSDSFSQQITMVSFFLSFFSLPEAILTEVSCRTWNSLTRVKQGLSGGSNDSRVCFLLTGCRTFPFRQGHVIYYIAEGVHLFFFLFFFCLMHNLTVFITRA